MLGHLQANAIGFNAHYANGLTAIFIACGQDVANVANAAVGITDYELTAEGDLYASVTLPSLTVATVGGGTGLGTSRECLQHARVRRGGPRAEVRRDRRARRCSAASCRWPARSAPASSSTPTKPTGATAPRATAQPSRPPTSVR